MPIAAAVPPPFTWAHAYFAAEWVVRIGLVALILVRKRKPNVALAWLAVALFEPLVGLFLYLLIGAIRVDPTHERRYEQLRSRPPAAEVRAGEDLVPPQHRDFIRLSEVLNLLPPTPGNSVDLEGDHDRFIQRLVADIDAATREVRLLYYIYWDDASGRAVSDALVRAAARAVTCRLLVDASGSRGFLRTAAPRLRAAGIDVRAALVVRPWRAFFVRADLRNHRKLAVIDGAVAWSGSHNVCDADYGGSAYGPWIDLSARIAGPAAAQLSAVFAEDWFAETGDMLGPLPAPQPPPLAAGVIQIFRSGPGRRTDALEPFIVGALHEAERRVIITSPYLIPTEPLLLELRVAVLRGVRVDLIVPARANHPLVHAAGRGFFDELLAAGVHIHLHSLGGAGGGGLLHAKTMLVDDAFALVGTANLDVRSLSLNFELNLLIFDRDTVASLLRHQAAYLAQSRELTLDHWRRRGRAKQLAEDLARLFGPLL